MYCTRRMRNRRSGRSKRGGETNEKKAIKIALGITPETQMGTEDQQKLFFAKLRDPVLMARVLGSWNTLADGDMSLYKEKDGVFIRKIGVDGKYVLSRRQQELADEFMKSSRFDNTFKTGHPDRRIFYTALINSLRTPKYMENLVEEIEKEKQIVKNVSAALSSNTPDVAGVAGVEQQKPTRVSTVAALRADRSKAQPELRETTDAAGVGVGSTTVLPRNAYKGIGASAKVVEPKEILIPDWKKGVLESRRKKAEAGAAAAQAAAAEAEAAAAQAAAAEAEKQRQAAEAEKQRQAGQDEAAAATAAQAKQAAAAAAAQSEESEGEEDESKGEEEAAGVLGATEAQRKLDAAAAAHAAQLKKRLEESEAIKEVSSGGSRRRHRRSHRRSNKKSRKGRKTRKSHRRHKGGRR